MTAAVETIVIGGGILGCAVAWRLAAVERREVLLLERNELGSGASARAAGLIVPLKAGMRSLNVAVACAMVTGEALRQLNAFPD